MVAYAINNASGAQGAACRWLAGVDLISITAGRRPGHVSRLLGPRRIGAGLIGAGLIGARAATSQLFEPPALSPP
jgi:hypothetical protein